MMMKKIKNVPEIVLFALLITLLYIKPEVLNQISKTILGKLILVASVIGVSTMYGRNAGLLSAVVAIIVLHDDREGLTNDETEDTLEEIKGLEKTSSDDDDETDVDESDNEADNESDKTSSDDTDKKDSKTSSSVSTKVSGKASSVTNDKKVSNSNSNSNNNIKEIMADEKKVMDDISAIMKTLDVSSSSNSSAPKKTTTDQINIDETLRAKSSNSLN